MAISNHLFSPTSENPYGFLAWCAFAKLNPIPRNYSYSLSIYEIMLTYNDTIRAISRKFKNSIDDIESKIETELTYSNEKLKKVPEMKKDSLSVTFTYTADGNINRIITEYGKTVLTTNFTYDTHDEAGYDIAKKMVGY